MAEISAIGCLESLATVGRHEEAIGMVRFHGSGADAELSHPFVPYSRLEPCLSSFPMDYQRSLFSRACCRASRWGRPSLFLRLLWDENTLSQDPIFFSFVPQTTALIANPLYLSFVGPLVRLSLAYQRRLATSEPDVCRDGQDICSQIDSLLLLTSMTV